MRSSTPTPLASSSTSTSFATMTKSACCSLAMTGASSSANLGFGRRSRSRALARTRVSSASRTTTATASLSRSASFRQLQRPEVFALASEISFEELIVDLPDGQVEVVGLSQGRVVVASRQYAYDEDARRDDRSGQRPASAAPGAITETKGNFVCAGRRCPGSGWVAVIGVENYEDVVTNENIRRPFFGVFVWNLVFAFMSVFLTFALGLGLALTLAARALPRADSSSAPSTSCPTRYPLSSASSSGRDSSTRSSARSTTCSPPSASGRCRG